MEPACHDGVQAVYHGRAVRKRRGRVGCRLGPGDLRQRKVRASRRAQADLRPRQRVQAQREHPTLIRRGRSVPLSTVSNFADWCSVLPCARLPWKAAGAPPASSWFVQGPRSKEGALFWSRFLRLLRVRTITGGLIGSFGLLALSGGVASLPAMASTEPTTPTVRTTEGGAFSTAPAWLNAAIPYVHVKNFVATVDPRIGRALRPAAVATVCAG